MNDPERVVLASLVITGTVVAVKAGRAGTLTPRVFVGLGTAAFVILGITAFAPSLGAALAVLLLVVTLLGRIEDVEQAGFEWLNAPRRGRKP
jgi:hypothetical protein